jgi:hypothetical protein
MKIPIGYPEGTKDGEKLMRCEDHGWIVTNKKLQSGVCAGDRMRITYALTPIEWVMWKLGRLK